MHARVKMRAQGRQRRGVGVGGSAIRKAHLGRRHGVVLRQEELQLEQAACVGL